VVEDDWLHGGDVAEAHFGNVEGANHVGPTIVVSAFEGAFLAWAQFTPLQQKK